MVDAWNSGDLEAALAFYTDDVVYSDAGTRGKLRGKDAMRKYFTTFFDMFEWRFPLTEAHSFADATDSGVVFWDLDVRMRESDRSAQTTGMDILTVRDGRYCRDEVYWHPISLGHLTNGSASATSQA